MHNVQVLRPVSYLCVHVRIYTVGGKREENPHQTSKDGSNLTRVVSFSSFARDKHRYYEALGTCKGTTDTHTRIIC